MSSTNARGRTEGALKPP
jgi:hypothetical protein